MANAFLITDVLFICLSIIILILIILPLTLKSFKNEYFNEIRENYVMSPIFDISLKSPIASCPNNQDVLPLGEWKGTKTGCDCIGLSAWRVPLTSSDRYTSGHCIQDEYRGGCRTVHSTPEKNFTVWKGREFCGAYGRKSYKDYLHDSVAFNESCKGNYHQCGILDSLNRKLCLPERQRCPINKIVINQSVIAPTNYKYSTIAFGNDYGYLHYTNEAIDEPILVKLKLSEGEICINPNQYNSKYPKDQFILDEIGNDYGCDDKVGNYTYDPRYIEVDQLSKSIVFPENEIYDFYGMYKGFPQKYPEVARKVEMQLYQRNFIGLNMTCIEESKLDQIDNEKRIEQNKKVNDMHIANCVMISLLISLIAIVILCNCCNGNYMKEEVTTLYYVLFGLYCLFLIPIFAIALSCYVVFNKTHLATTCGDDIFNNQLRIAQKEIDLFEGIDISIASFSILGILIFVALIIFLKRDAICSINGASSGKDKGKEEIGEDNVIKDNEEQEQLNKKSNDYNFSLLYPAPNYEN